ncbi:MAG: phosphatidylglycerophosphatase A family protein [Cetobacterium sp.]|uniref:phosphatidylglycerophosphatase A family protein n=1 Tax=Cetobacterium TaxID=180162 RepID=UPI001F0515BF|nr:MULTISPECIES: phosphatidylglycerophosphatase A [Cetobacterium]MCX3068026.1 phosphatidylglycerophosphatase A [Cetobacterium somerae]UPO97115.1 phosphatidylglycerophosphatase A [Cetobacterium somerae]
MNRKVVKNLATVFGLGEMPVAPGTFGTLGGIPIYIGLVLLKKIFPNNMIYNSFYFMFLMTFFAISVYVCDIAEREIFKEKDPQKVVIDEVLGFLTTLFLINPVGIFQTIMAIIIGFIIFRFFDITKIGPIYKSQFFGNGVGVVLDDFLAGVIGNFLMVCIWTIFF